ncbi:WD40 repeat domain-containing protein [Streptomyces paradoxus]|uniref:WD40 repeat domain-containing protein n=1 Tax=Streptomyces paradoxus TaxID=66375 RepID=UPI0037FA7F4A
MAEEPMLPTVVRELLHTLPPGTNEWDLFPRLTGEHQPLWGLLTHCVAENDDRTLHQVMTGRTPLHDILDEAPGWTQVPEPVDAPFVEREPAPARALRAHAALGLALVGDADAAEEHLRTGASWLSRSASAAQPPGPVGGAWSAPADSRHGERLARLLAADTVPDSVRTHLSVVLLALDGALPKRASGPRLTVLADRGTVGARFQLQLDLVRGLPSALLPDPQSMSAFLGDEGFQRSLDDAWRTARRGKAKGAVLWSLRDGDGPVDHVNDSSFGAAFAVLLGELGRTRGSRLGPLRVRRVNPRTSLVGAVSARNPRVIESVTGYETKLSVVDDGDRVVVPERDKDRALAVNDRATIVGAVTVDEAAREVRRLDTRAVSRLVAGVLATGLVASLVAWGFASGESEKNNRRAVAAGLAAQAVRLKSSEPRTAGLLALAGYQIDPRNKDAENAIQEVLETNRNTVRSWAADRTVVDVLAVDAAGHRAYTSGADDAIKVWDTRSGRKLAEVKGRAAALVRGAESGILAAHDGRDLKLFDTAGDRPEALGEVKAPSCTGQYSEIVGMGFTSNGSALTTVWDEGAVATVDPVSRTVTSCVRLRDVAGKKLLAELPPARLAIDADVLSASYDGPGGGADEVVMLLTTNDVVALDLRTKKVSLLIPAEQVPGSATLVQASEDVVTLALDGGVLAWDRPGRGRIAYPLGGPSRPLAMEQEGDDVVVAGPDGTAVVPVRSGPDSAPGPLSVPSGGRSVAAVRADDGTVVAAGYARVTVLGNHPVQRALPPARPSTGTAFGSGHTLLLTDYTENSSYGAYAIDLDSAPRPAGAAPPSYEPVTDYPASSAYINDLAVSDKFVAAAGQSRGLGAVTVWKRDGTPLQELLMSPEQDRKRKAEERIVAQVRFVPEARLLVARNALGDVGIWSTRTWQRVGTVPLKSGSTEIAIHGRTGVFTEGEGENTRLVMMDLVTRKKLRTVAAPGVVRLSLSEDGSRLVALSWATGTVSVLDGRKLTPLRAPLRLPAGDLARDVAISPDGRQVASAMGDHVLVHTLKTGQQAMPPLRETDGNAVVQVKWSPDGAYLAGATLPPRREHREPGVVNLWKMTEGSLEQRMCDWTDGGLSEDEWEKHVDESVSYIDLCKDGAR